MKQFETIRSVAAWLPEQNIDTDAIFPARYLLLLEKAGVREYLFRDRRYREDGSLRQEFVLNQPRFRKARILIANSGFGCGSSREQAVWALVDYGIGCVIAPSFGDIFFSNSFKNGLLPVVLPRDKVKAIGERAESGEVLEVDLEAGVVRCVDQSTYAIEISPDRRRALLNGWDELELILRQEGEAITATESRLKQSQPWLFASPR